MRFTKSSKWLNWELQVLKAMSCHVFKVTILYTNPPNLVFALPKQFTKCLPLCFLCTRTVGYYRLPKIPHMSGVIFFLRCTTPIRNYAKLFYFYIVDIFCYYIGDKIYKTNLCTMQEVKCCVIFVALAH